MSRQGTLLLRLEETSLNVSQGLAPWPTQLHGRVHYVTVDECGHLSLFTSGCLILESVQGAWWWWAVGIGIKCNSALGYSHDNCVIGKGS